MNLLKLYMNKICEYLKLDNKYTQLLKNIRKFLTYHYNMGHNDNKNDIFPYEAVRKPLENVHDGTYYHKYQKYKHKYLYLLNDLTGGGKKKLVIHISGPIGSGKSTLGNRLQEKFGNKIVVKDIDDLQREFEKNEYGFNEIKKFDAEKYQKWIDDFVNKQNKPLIFVGLNNLYWWDEKLYYDMHPDYKFYIELDTDIIFKQKCNRWLTVTFGDNKKKENLFRMIIENEKKIIKHIQEEFEDECSYEKTKKRTDIWNIDYKTQGYKFMSRENIFTEVSKMLEKYAR